MAGKLEVGEHLRLVDGQKIFDRFQFYNHRSGHQKIEAEPGFDSLGAVDDGERNLSLKWDPALVQFVREANLIDAFQ